jgi:hypothetical protein
MKSQIESWLQKEAVPYHIAAVLPSELYKDASHPLGKGYEMLAGRLFESESFKVFLGGLIPSDRNQTGDEDFAL